MSRVLVTGASNGLGFMTAQLLIRDGHRVVLHTRDRHRAEDTLLRAPGAEGVVVGDVSSLSQMRSVADQVNRLGRFDAVIHNVGIGYREHARLPTEDGLPHVFAINVLAPYVLTALIEPPDRLVYLSSAIHRMVDVNFDDLLWTKRDWHGEQAYGETKLYDAMLAFTIARLWPKVRSNALEPGWVPTTMGGPDAPDDLAQAHLTQAWLAVSDDALARATGGYFLHKTLLTPNPAARREDNQHQLIDACAKLTDIKLSA